MTHLDERRRSALAAWQELAHGSQPVIYVGAASCGRAAGALDVLQAIDAFLAEYHLQAQVVQVGCIGPCYLEPLMDVALPGSPRVCYSRVTPAKVKRILASTLVEGKHLPALSAGHFGGSDFTAASGIPRFFDQPMLKPQARVVLQNCGLIDPEDLDHALAHQAYAALQLALDLSPEAVTGVVRDAGLRGRGGAGFPTYKKWEVCRAAPGDLKYVICNADEGDPGAFMNRALIESDPHAVLEGILIAGYAVGARQGIVYVRAEYPLAVQRLRKAVQQARQAGLLGMNILDSGFDFDIAIKEGAGAFVCGEETALIASLEGQRGTPRPRPPYPAVKGLNGCPTLINNTETLGTVPRIVLNGADWYRGFGAAGNTGTKTFSLVGKVRRTGLIEVPLGITLRQIVEEIGGGTERPFKAVQTGGPLGGCLPEAALDTPVNYETLRAGGSIMGSGGLIVMDESTCMVDIAHFFTAFAQKESCGNCTSCRVGTRILTTLLDKITRGEGEPGDIEQMRRAASTMEKTSLCGLGQAASNPVISTLRHFMDEYRAHIEEKYCPAAVCPGLFEYHILAERCSTCGLCVKACPSGAITGERRQIPSLDTAQCTQCGACVKVCPRDAIVGAPVSRSAVEAAL